MLKLFSSSHLAVITDEFDKTLDSPMNFLINSKQVLEQSLCKAGNLSYLFSFNESAISVPSNGNESSPKYFISSNLNEYNKLLEVFC